FGMIADRPLPPRDPAMVRRCRLSARPISVPAARPRQIFPVSYCQRSLAASAAGSTHNARGAVSAEEGVFGSPLGRFSKFMPDPNSLQKQNQEIKQGGQKQGKIHA
ncbi:hypothetical protein, partial [Pseudophaeobacter arcticus]|uniref:hypothetical protein n=1 Tax=Pseudophaeobacter arcticus TaxID=385492 RepID=UPI003342D3B5